jgi:hypothetical protein
MELKNNNTKGGEILKKIGKVFCMGNKKRGTLKKVSFYARGKKVSFYARKKR